MTSQMDSLTGLPVGLADLPVAGSHRPGGEFDIQWRTSSAATAIAWVINDTSGRCCRAARKRPTNGELGLGGGECVLPAAGSCCVVQRTM